MTFDTDSNENKPNGDYMQKDTILVRNITWLGQATGHKSNLYGTSASGMKAVSENMKETLFELAAVQNCDAFL